MKIALAQSQFYLGDFKKNRSQVLDIVHRVTNKADLLCFPEGGLWGYFPRDFLYQDKYFKIQEQQLQIIKSKLPKNLLLLIGAFKKTKQGLYNGVYLIEKNKSFRFFAKEHLADYGVFFESRYFQKGQTCKNIFYWNKKRIQILICEDLWNPIKISAADAIITFNASPYAKQKHLKRLAQVKQLAKKQACPVIYLNTVGAQDHLIFDGGSFVVNSKSQVLYQASFFKTELKIINCFKSVKTQLALQKTKQMYKPLACTKQAIILGIQSFFKQTNFSKAHLGLSGGLDSAIVAYFLVQALGPSQVTAYYLPGPYSSTLSQTLAQKMAKNLKIKYVQQDITSLFQNFYSNFFTKQAPSNLITTQNLQARIRMICLMIFANESSSLLIGTSNKSEIATGYSSLYGDMTGALCPIGDLYKTEVLQLARYINTTSQIFPKNLLTREPTAELAPNQKDKDSLLPYPQLDKILTKILTHQNITSQKEKKLAQQIHSQEFKRKQAPFILKLSDSDLGESWKQVIAHKFFDKNT